MAARAWGVTTLLDSVTTSQTSAVDDLTLGNPHYVDLQLTETGTRVGVAQLVVQASSDGGATYRDIAMLMGPAAAGTVKLQVFIPQVHDHLRIKFSQGVGGSSAASTATAVSSKIA